MTYCPLCQNDYQTTSHLCPSIRDIFTPNPDHPEVRVRVLEARVAELEAFSAGAVALGSERTAERDRYREALEKIAAIPLGDGQMHNAYEMRRIADEALKG